MGEQVSSQLGSTDPESDNETSEAQALHSAEVHLDDPTARGEVSRVRATIPQSARQSEVGSPFAGAERRERNLLSQLLSQLQAIQSSSGLDRIDGWPLYRYRVTAHQLEQLEGVLRHVLRTSEQLGSVEAAAFVLYAASSFCRKYEGGPWSWSTILAPLGVAKRLPDTELVVTRGLKWWRREVGWSGKRHEYLVSLAREGGLPLSVVCEESGGGTLREYLRRLLIRREACNRPTRELAEELSELLPQSLRRDIVWDACAELIDAIAKLRAAVPRSCSDISAWLEIERPAWRTELPLYLEHEVAERLLSGLVAETPLEVNAVENEFRLITELHSAPLRFLCRLAFPKAMAVEALQSALSVDEELPSRIVLQVINGMGERTVVSIGSQQAGHFYFRRAGAEEPHIPFGGGQMRLLVSGAGQDLGLVALAGSEALSDDVPWGFHRSEMDAIPRVRECGSARRTGPTLLLAVPAERGTLTTLEGTHEDLGTEVTTQRRIVRLSGSARWMTTEGDAANFSTGSVDNGHEYSVNGRLLRLPFGQSAWLGIPKLRAHDDLSGARDVPLNELRYRFVGAAHQWRGVNQDCYGDVILRVQDRTGTVSFQIRVLVLPKDFSYRVLPTNSSSGALELASASIVATRVLDAAVTSEIKSPRRGLTVLQMAADPAPQQACLRATFTGGGSCTLRVPFPSVTCGFENSRGELLRRGTRIAIDQLRRYVAVARSPDPSTRFSLEANVQGMRRTIAPLVRTAPESQWWYLPLASVAQQLEAALPGRGRIDAITPLRVVALTGSVNPKAEAEGTVNLGWHELVLQIDVAGDQADVRLDANTLDEFTAQQRQAFQIRVQPLHHPELPAQVLRESESGRWSFIPEKGSKGPWLFSGWVFGQLVTRPRMQRVGETEAPEDYTDSFEHAIRVATEERHALLKDAAASAAYNVADSRWRRLDAFLDTFSSFPPVTYDANCAVAQNPATAVLAVMRAGKERFEHVWEGLEGLGIVWSATSVRHWVGGVRAYFKWEEANPDLVDVLGGRTGAIRRLLPGVFGQVPFQPRFLPVLVSAFWRAFAGLPGMENDYIGVTRTAQGRGQFAQMLAHERSVYLLRSVGIDQGISRGRFDEIFEDNHYAICAANLLGALNVPDCPQWEGPTLAPLAAAYVMAHAISPERDLLREIRYFRAMDEQWFDIAHAYALAVFLGELMEQDNDYIDQF